MTSQNRRCGCGIMVVVEWDKNRNLSVWSADYERHVCGHVGSISVPLADTDHGQDTAPDPLDS